MRTMTVFVLTCQGKSGESEDVSLDVEDVFTTKTAAKEKLRKRKEEIKEYYEESYSGDYEIAFDDPTLFSITSCSSCVWDELLITEKEISI